MPEGVSSVRNEGALKEMCNSDYDRDEEEEKNEEPDCSLHFDAKYARNC